MQKEIIPSYLPAVGETFVPKDGGEPKTVYRPYESIAIEELQKQAENGSRGAQLQLGIRYFHGVLDAEQDYKKAFEYLKQAADQNVQDALFLLAGYYMSEEIPLLEKNLQKGLRMLTLAAELGSWEAMEKLAIIYRNGADSIHADHEKAYEWAVQGERITGLYWSFYAQQNFVDFTEKLRQILQANTRFALMLTSCYADGIGTKRNLQKALKAAEQGAAFVTQATGLAKVPVFEERCRQLRARMKKDTARADKAAKEAAKKTQKK